MLRRICFCTDCLPALFSARKWLTVDKNEQMYYYDI